MWEMNALIKSFSLLQCEKSEGPTTSLCWITDSLATTSWRLSWSEQHDWLMAWSLWSTARLKKARNEGNYSQLSRTDRRFKMSLDWILDGGFGQFREWQQTTVINAVKADTLIFTALQSYLVIFICLAICFCWYIINVRVNLVN